jgi:hypothetical protein
MKIGWQDSDGGKEVVTITVIIVNELVTKGGSLCNDDVSPAEIF